MNGYALILLNALCFATFHAKKLDPDGRKDFANAVNGIDDEINDIFSFLRKKPAPPKETCLQPAKCPVQLPKEEEEKKITPLKKFFYGILGHAGNNYEHCENLRKDDVMRARYYYQITDDTKKPTIAFPLRDIPFLNQTMDTVKYVTAIDPIESRWLSLYSTLGKIMGIVRDKIGVAFENHTLYTLIEYQMIKASFEKAFTDLKTPQYFGTPGAFPHFTDVTKGLWKTDRSFVQSKFGGPCPFYVRKVTKDGDVGMKQSELTKMLNPHYNFDKMLTDVYGNDLTIDEAVDEALLFVLHHESYNDMETLEDILDRDPNDNRTLMDVTSPITIFVLKGDELRVVAIQVDYKPTAKVYSHYASSETEWLLAKAIVDQSDFDMCNAKFHLGTVHFYTTVYCLSFRRHLSQQHPLYDVFKWHCEGTVPHISLAWPVLSFDNSFGHQYFSIGHKGFIKLAKIGYSESKYGAFDFQTLLKKNGLDDGRIKYFPFRDDGEVIYKELDTFANSLIDIYYHNDQNVVGDKEMQSFANELSVDGNVKPDGGKGKVKAFPKKFETRQQVKTFIRRFLWYNILHTVSNYATAPVFVPKSPSKLYYDSTPNPSIYHYLPDVKATVGSTFLGDLLGGLRVNRLMDYSDKVQDFKLNQLVYKTYQRLNTCVQKQLEERNYERFKRDELTYQYLEPKWITNSIHI